MNTGTPIFGQSSHSEQIARILASDAFQRRKAPSKLLQELVKLTIAKRNVTRTMVLESDAFTKKTKTYVSVNKDRLKKYLDAYYEKDGAVDDLEVYLLSGDFTVYVRPRAISSSAAEAPQWKTRRISLLEFERFLIEQCEADGLIERDRNAKLKVWVRANLSFGTNIPMSAHSACEDFFAYLRGRASGRDRKAAPLTFDQMVSLAEHLGVHRIMLDPLRSSPVDTDGVALRFHPEAETNSSGPRAPEAPRRTTTPAPVTCVNGEFWTVGAHGRKDYGSGASYSIPDIRLSGTDAAFVRLLLDPGGHSTNHHHAGDELVLCVAGTVLIDQLDSGVTIALRPGSYTHFYSEQTHGVRNTSSEPAELFIIRFYQSGKSNTRQALRRRLWAFAEGKGELSDLVIGWILAAAADRSIPKEIATDDGHVPDEVLNRLGLAQLLTRLQKPEKRPEPRRKRRDDQEPLGSGAWLAALQRNLKSVTKANLVEVSELYGIFEMLAFEFLFPIAPRQVVVTRATEDDPERRNRSDWIDMADIIRSIPAGRRHHRIDAPVAEVKYEVPVRSLACSDILITWLTLQPGFGTRENRHPGCELILPINGEATVEYQHRNRWLKLCRVAAPGELAHYDSARPHRVFNSSQDEPAELFVIRFFGEERRKRRVARSATHK